MALVIYGPPIGIGGLICTAPIAIIIVAVELVSVLGDKPTSLPELKPHSDFEY